MLNHVLESITHSAVNHNSVWYGLWGLNRYFMVQLWVLNVPTTHGLWGITKLWVFTAYRVRGRPKAMGYYRVWVAGAMG